MTQVTRFGCRGSDIELLQTLSIDKEQGQESGPDELDQDDFSIAGSFDPYDTLLQIWDDPDATLPYMLVDDIADDNNLEVVTDITSDSIRRQRWLSFSFHIRHSCPHTRAQTDKSDQTKNPTHCLI